MFSLGVKETAYGSSVLVSGANFLKLPKDVELSTLTTAVDLSSYRTFGRCNLLVLHQAKGGSKETPSVLHRLCGRVSTYHSSGQHFCGVHKHRQSLRTHADGGKIFKITSDVAVCCPKFGLAVAWPLPVAHIYWGTLSRGWCHPGDADEHAIHSERQFERLGAKKYHDGPDPGYYW